MDPQNVPEELVELAMEEWGNRPMGHPRRAFEAILAAVLPAHAAIVLRTATAEQCKDIIREATDQAMSERLAELEQGIRAKVAEEIEAAALRNGDGSSWDFGMQHAAEIARGGQ